MTTSLGLDISIPHASAEVTDRVKDSYAPGEEKNLPTASNDMEKQRARRKTPLMSAARISALCHPYEYRESEELPLVSCWI